MVAMSSPTGRPQNRRLDAGLLPTGPWILPCVAWELEGPELIDKKERDCRAGPDLRGTKLERDQT